MSKKVGASRKIVITLLSFSLSVLIALTGVLCVVSATALSGSYAVKALGKSEFGEIELNRIREHFISYGSAGNVDETFFIGYFEQNVTSKTVTADMAKSVLALYGGEDIKDEKYFFDDLHSALFKYAEEMHMDVEDEEIAQGIREFTGDLIELYGKYVSFPYASSVSPALKKAASLTPLAAAVFALLSIAIAVVILLSYKKKLTPVSFLGASFGGAGLMLIIFPALVLITRQAEKFTLTDEAFRSFFIELANGFTIGLILCGIVFTAAWILLYVLSGKRGNKQSALGGKL